MSESRPSLTKAYYRLGEAARIAGVEGHVLRYWEAEFPMLQPRKSDGGQRRYSAADLETVLRIKELVHVQGFTLAGARRRLADEVAGSDGESELRRCLREVGDELQSILTVLEADDTL